MVEKIYLDSNIYLDYFEDRIDNIRPLGEFAFQLIKRTLQCEFEIVVSDLVIKELKNYIPDERVKKLFEELKAHKKISFDKIKLNEEYCAKLESRKWGLPPADATHYCFCKNRDIVLISRDNHFDLILDKEVNVLKPEEI